MTDPISPQKVSLPLVIGGIVLMILGVLTARYILGPHQRHAALPNDLQATYLEQGKPIADINLTDDNHKPFDAARFKDKWTFMFFGYTNCPDVCPSTMLVMKGVWQSLPADARSEPSPQMVFVSVDPDRDTLDKLKKYVAFFNPDFLGVTGKAAQIDKLTNQVGVLYGFDDDPDGKGYTVKHSAQIILIDPKGDMRAVFSPPFKTEDMVKTFVQIRNYYKG